LNEKKRSVRLYFKACGNQGWVVFKELNYFSGSIESEEVFSWEDDDDDSSSPIASAKIPTIVQKASRDPSSEPADDTTSTETVRSKEKFSAPHSQPDTPTSTSPRQSSESGESYDLVPSVHLIRGEDKTNKKGDGDDGDSDWE
jgi:hypothetical protein